MRYVQTGVKRIGEVKLHNDIFDIRNDLRRQSHRISDDECHYNIVETKVSTIESDRNKLQLENLRKNFRNTGTLNEVQPDFNGIPVRDDRKVENYETSFKKIH